MSIGTIARLTLHEALRRRILTAALIEGVGLASLVFALLFKLL